MAVLRVDVLRCDVRAVPYYWISAEDAYVLTLIGLTDWDFLGWLLFI